MGVLTAAPTRTVSAGATATDSRTGTSEMADRQFWGVVNHRSGSDAQLQFEPMPTIGQNPKQTIGQKLIDL
jgi:hypothetical protein